MTLHPRALILAVVAACAAPTESPATTDVAAEADSAEEEDFDPGDFMKGPPPSLEGPLTYAGQIQPILRYYCTPCHLGDTPTGCVGGTCFVSFYEALLFPAYNNQCTGLNKAQCGMGRILISLPTSGVPDTDKLIGPTDEPIVVAEAYIKALEAWLAAGTP